MLPADQHIGTRGPLVCAGEPLDPRFTAALPSLSVSSTDPSFIFMDYLTSTQIKTAATCALQRAGPRSFGVPSGGAPRPASLWR